MQRLLTAIVLILTSASSALAVEHVVFKRDGREIRIEGKLLTEAEDGGLLVMARDGVLWAVQPKELVDHKKDARPFEPLDAKQVARQTLAQLPEGFEVHTTAHYVICYNTSRAYAQWCGGLYERLYRAFTNYWSRRGFKLHEPELPLVALVFADSQSYKQQARGELGDAVDAIVGYYSLRTNRVMMYDLTGVQALRDPGSRRGTTAEINRMLSQPAASPMVATIVHEATHQIAFNCGLQTRYTDVPLWVSEGIAVYFETPDLKSSRGWRGVGAVNRPRLQTFRRNLPGRQPGALASLIVDDKRMRDTKTAADAYADAWALNYYLLQRKPKEYIAYLKMLSEKSPLVWEDQQGRMAEFQAFFGEDLKSFDLDFVKNMQKVR